MQSLKTHGWRRCCWFFPSKISLLVTTSIFPFLSRGNLGNLTFFPSQLVHSQDHRVGYCDSKTKIGRTSVKLPSSQTEFYLNRSRAVWNPPGICCMKNSRRWQVLWCFLGTRVYAYLLQWNQTSKHRMSYWEESVDCLASFPIQWNGRSVLEQPQWLEQIQCQVKGRNILGRSFRSREMKEEKLLCKQPVALLITGNVNKEVRDWQTTLEHQDSSGYVSEILRVGSQHCTPLW